MFDDIHQNKIKYLLVFLAIILIIVIAFVALQVNKKTGQKNPGQNQTGNISKESAQEEIMKSISVPTESSNIQPEVPANVSSSLSVPAKTKKTVPAPVSREVINSLSAPAK